MPILEHTNAWWDGEARAATCLTCRPAATSTPVPYVTTAPPTPPAAADPLPMSMGVAGGSARLEYGKRHQRRVDRFDARWGHFAGIVKFLSDDPQSTTAWAKGSEGERKLAQHLLEAIGDRAVLLNDRKVPGTRGNIDHIVIAASGIWVIDAKNYKGLVDRRDVGGWFRRDERLYVGGRDRTTAVEGLDWQVDAVRAALGTPGVPITTVACFVGAEWKRFAKPFQINGTWVIWSNKLADLIAAPGPLTAVDVNNIAGRLATALPPKVSTP
jgi:hypothetical protein